MVMAKIERRDSIHNGCLSIFTSCFKPSGQPKSSDSKTSIKSTTSAPARGNRPVKPATLPANPIQTSSVPIDTTVHVQSEDGNHGMAVSRHENNLPASADRSELWQQALEQSDEKTKKRIEQLDQTEKFVPIDHLIELIGDKQDTFKANTPGITINGKKVIWRECSSRVIKGLTVFGDVAIQFAPTPTSSVWSAVKVLLNANVTECTEMIAVLGCIDRILPIIERGAIYEHAYLKGCSDKYLKSSTNLREALVQAYKQVLKLLVQAERKVGEGSIVRFWYALQKPDKVAGLIKDLRDAEDRVTKDADACGVEQGQAKYHEICQRFGHLDRAVQAIGRSISEAERQQALNFVSQIHVGNQHHKKSRNRLSGTGNWLLQHEDFVQWKHSETSEILWLTGQVGAGKTVLASHVIDHCKNDAANESRTIDEGLAFFYYSKADQETRDEPLACVLRSFVEQLFALPYCSEKLHRNLMQRIDDAKKAHRTFLNSKECESLLFDFVNEVPRTFLILDGLDEFPERDANEIIVALTNLVRRSNRIVQLFVSSRDEGHIRKTFYAIEDQEVFLEVNIGHNNHADIQKFVEEETEKSFKDYSPNQKQDLIGGLTGGADGMFRWAYLQMEQIKKCRTWAAVSQRLGNLPTGLTEAYDELYDQNEGPDKTYLQRAVKWVMFAYEPLPTHVLLSAIQLGQSDGGRLQIDEYRMEEAELEEICRHLISKDSNNNWKFTHASVKEYFQDAQNERLKDWIGVTAQIELADLLVLLVTSHEEWRTQRYDESVGEDSESECDDDDDEESSEKQPDTRNVSLRKANPLSHQPRIILQKYICVHWPAHVKAIQHLPRRCSQVSQHLKDFMTMEGEPYQSSPAYQKWVQFLQGRPYNGIVDKPSHLLPAENWVFGIIALGLFPMTEQWGLPSLNLKQVNSVGADLLTIAAHFAHADTCAQLIAQGSDVNRIFEYDRYGDGDGDVEKSSALLVATRRASTSYGDEQAYIQVVEVLLDNGANPNIDTSCRPLCEAACAGDLAILELLLRGARCDERRIPANIDYVCQSLSHWCALEGAVYYDHIEAAQKLCEAGATVDLQRCSGGDTPLMSAASQGRLNVVKYLVEQQNANVHIEAENSRWGGVLASAYCGDANVEVISYLIEHARAAPQRLFDDISKRHSVPRKSHDIRKRDEMAMYLIRKEHATIKDFERLFRFGRYCSSEFLKDLGVRNPQVSRYLNFQLHLEPEMNKEDKARTMKALTMAIGRLHKIIFTSVGSLELPNASTLWAHCTLRDMVAAAVRRRATDGPPVSFNSI